MNRNLVVNFLAVFTGLMIVSIGGCGREATPVPLKPAEEKALIKPQSPGERRWDAILAEAKKEGSVSIYTIWPADIRTALASAFKQKYQIDLEFTTFSRGAEMLARVQAENRAGIYAADLFGAGGPSLIGVMKPEGVLGPVEPLLIVPEVTDSKLWMGERFPFLDNDRLGVGMSAALNRFVLYNTNLVKEGELTTYKDTLKPQYKGKIVLQDPTVTGAGNAFISHLALEIWTLEETREFFHQLIKQQQAVVDRDRRLQVESVARGKFAIGLAAPTEIITEFIKVGAPLEVAITREGAYISPGGGAMGVPKRLAHPNATTAFVNWLLGKEGQEVYARAYGQPSLRTDISLEGVYPKFLPQKGEKLWLDSEERILFLNKMQTIARDIIEAASR